MKAVIDTLKRYRKAFLTLIGAAIFFLIGYKLIRSWNEIKMEVSVRNYYFLILSIILFVTFFIMLAFAWRNIINELVVPKGKKGLVLIYSQSQLARYLPGGIWNYLGRAALLKKIGITEYIVTIQSSVMEAILLVISGLIIGLVLSFRMLNAFEIFSIFAVMLFLFIILLKLNPIVGVIYRIFLKKEIRYLEYRKWFLVKLLFFYLLIWLVSSTAFSLFIASFKCTGTFESTVYTAGSFPLSWCFGFVSFMPGGIGTRETALVYLLNRAGSETFAYFISVASRILIIAAEVFSFVCIFCVDKYKSFRIRKLM